MSVRSSSGARARPLAARGGRSGRGGHTQAPQPARRGSAGPRKQGGGRTAPSAQPARRAEAGPRKHAAGRKSAPQPARRDEPGARKHHAGRNAPQPARRDEAAGSHGRRERAGSHDRRPEAARPFDHGRQHARERGEVTAGPLGLPPRSPEQERELARLAAASEPPRVGDWLWTCREGAERDCLEELLLARDRPHAPDRPIQGPQRTRIEARGFAPSLVLSSHAPRDSEGRIELTFARQGFQLSAIARELDEAALATSLARAAALLVHSERFALHVFVADSALGNRLQQRAERIAERLESELLSALPSATRVPDVELRRVPAELIQVCLIAPDTAALGVLPSDQALSIWPGGRARMRVAADRPSRAARKLEEAFAWLGTGPGPGELCVDLGAAPGGWSWLLLNRRARVIAVDPAKMDPQLASQRRLSHVQGSAFEWQPDETVDWLFCDMAWRPLEVAQMLGRWARRRQTRMLVANFKLPMKRKAEMVRRIAELLAASGYTNIRMRQLYHDREEITLTARV